MWAQAVPEHPLHRQGQASSPTPIVSAWLATTRRSRIHALDNCLEHLEAASEGGARQVSPKLAARISKMVPSVAAGITISEALDLVFKEQEAVQRFDPDRELSSVDGTKGSSVGRLDERADPIDRTAAQVLTDQIKEALEPPSLLLLEAHERRAWYALGYRSWEAYARLEFGLSRSRSYELIDHGRVIKAVMTAARLKSLPEISAYAAEQLKPALGFALEQIASRVSEDAGETHARQVVREVVARTRADLKKSAAAASSRAIVALHETNGARSSGDHAVCEESYPRETMRQLRSIIEFLIELPNPEAVLRQVSHDDQDCLAGIAVAAGKLTDLATAWERIR
jgi:hypothetical protein